MAEVETKEMRNMANISILVPRLSWKVFCAILFHAPERTCESCTSEHATGNEFAVESTGWRPQSQRYGQISLPTSTKKVHQEVAGKIVLAALGTNGSALQYASERLRTDPKFVLSAVTQQGRALEHAPATLRANKDIVMTS